jgi:hypothetical protein
VKKNYLLKGRRRSAAFGYAAGERNFFSKILPFVLLLCLLTYSSAPGESGSAASKENQKIQAFPQIPRKYGEVIYQSNGEGSKQIYIIGTEHRNTITCYNGINTAKVQAEVYRIGEWLIQHEGVRLLLPEGFFTGKTEKGVLRMSSAEKNRTNGPRLLDPEDLEKRLADNRTYINAVILLKENYDVRVRQVENRFLYDAVHGAIGKLEADSVTPSCDLPSLKSQLNYLQEKRVAAMLQEIPAVVDEEFQRGNIKNKRALFTIGLSHLPLIIRYFNDKRIEIHNPLPAPDEDGDYVADLNLLKEKFGITIIVPQKLADEDRVLKLCGMDKIIAQCRKQTSPLSPQKSP